MARHDLGILKLSFLHNLGKLKLRHLHALQLLSKGLTIEQASLQIPSVKYKGQNLRGEAALDYLIQQIYDLLGIRHMGMIVAAAIRAGLIAGPDRKHLPAKPLSELEEQITLLVEYGLSNEEIAHQLSISVPKVRDTLGVVFRKHGVKKRTALCAIRAKNSLP